MVAPRLMATVSLAGCLALAGSHSLAAGDKPGGSEIAIVSDNPPGQGIQDALSEYGSKITDVVQTPDGKYLVGATKPRDAAAAEALQSSVSSVPGVSMVESNVCYEIYPQDPKPADSRTKTDPEAPDPAGLFDQPTEVPWDSSGLEESVSADGTREFHSTTRDQQQDSTRTRTRTRTSLGWDMVTEPPPEYPYQPEETDTLSCDIPSVEGRVGPEIRLNLRSGDPGQFLYPRPLPLQLIARDYDLLDATCTGCNGAPSTMQQHIEDRIGSYRWNLDGKGSLNQPFKNLDDGNQAEIDRLKRLIRETTAKIQALEAEKAALDATRDERKKALEDEIAALETQKAAVESELNELTPKINEAESNLANAENTLREALAEIDRLQGEIDDLNERIKELQDRIDGKPSAETQQIASQLESLEQQIEDKQAELERLKADNVGREQSLAQAYDQAISNLVAARQQLASARGQVVEKQDQIVALENRLYSNPAALQAQLQAGSIQRLGFELQTRFLGGGVPQTLELTNKALLVFRAANPDQREQALEDFQKERDRLLQDLQQQCSGFDAARANDCRARLAELQSEVDGLGTTLAEALANPQSGGSPRDYERLEELRNELADLEAGMRAAEQQVEAAEQAVTDAQARYLDGLNDMLEAEATLTAEVVQLQAEAQATSLELEAARAKDEQERLEKTPDWLEEIADLRKQIEELESEIAAKRLEAELAQEEVDQFTDELRRLNNQKAVLEARRDFLQMQIDRKREELQAIDTETQAIEAEITRLEGELATLKQQLEDELKKKATATTGNKNAGGQQVFFIPPPLEETDGFDKAKFDEHTAKVAEKEAEYEAAKSAKAQLQDDAYKILKGFTEQLWAVKAAKKTISDLDEEIGKLEQEKDKRQSDVAQERNDGIAQEQERKGELESQKTEQESTRDEKQRVEDQDKKRVEDREKELNDATRAVSDAEQQVSNAQTTLDSAEEARRRTNRQQSDLMNRFRRTVSDQQNAQAQLARAESAAARAAARNDIPGLAASRKEANRLERQVEELEQQIDAQRPPILELEQVYVSRVEAVNSAQTALDDAQRDLREKKKTFWDKVKLVKSAQDDLKESTEERLEAERSIRKTEDDIKRQDEKVKAAQEEQDKAVEEDEEVKEKDKALEEKNKAKEDAEKAKNTALTKLTALTQEKKDWDTRKTKAEDDLNKARDELQAARDALKTFLEQQLREVRHSVTINLAVEDDPLPAFRKKDPIRTGTITINYASRRPPQVNGPSDDIEPPGNPAATQSICNVSINWEPEPPNREIDPDPRQDMETGEDGLEPQTIALYYQQGAPLYHMWPPVKAKVSAAAAAAAAQAGGAGGNGGAADPAAGAGGNAAAGNAADGNAPAADGADGDGAGSDEPDKPKILVNAATPFVTGADDLDEIIGQCTTGGGDGILVGDGGESISEGSGEGAGGMCTAGDEDRQPIDDVTHVKWVTDTYTSQAEITTMIQVPKVRPEACEDDTEFDVSFLDSGLQWADSETTKKGMYRRHAGEMGDAPEEYGDFGKNNSIELRFQIYEGGHNGKRDQTVEWKLGGVQPASVGKDKYGLDEIGKDSQTRMTGPDGYSRVNFLLDERWGMATVTAKWKRDKEICATATMKITRPLRLRELNVGFAPKNGWDKGKEAWDGDSNYEGLADGLEGDGPETGPSIAVGLIDDWQDPVDGKKINFSILQPDEAGIDPAEMETHIYGLAWSHATDVPEDSKLKFKAEVEEELQAVTTPSSIEAEQSTETQNRFQIGPEGARFTIETDEPFVLGQAFSSSAKLILEGDVGDIPVKFGELQLEADGVVVDDDSVAVEGSVIWTVTSAGGEPKPFKIPGPASLEFKLEKLGLSAGSDAILNGTVKIPESEQDEVEFEAKLGPKGFIGRVSNFPELEFANVKLEKGAAIVVDMHREEDPQGIQLCIDTTIPCAWTGKGLVIVQAGLLLPESMKGEAEKPPKISVKNLFFNSTGINGEINVDYTVSAKLGKVDFAIEKIGVGFQQNELRKGEFKGKMTLDDPFHGNIGADMSLDRSGKYSFQISTDRPVTAPSLGLTINLRKVGAEYDQPKELFTFELEGQLRSKTFTDIDVNKFVVKSTGDIEADVDVNKDIQVGKGFDVHLGSFKLLKTETDFKMSLEDAGFKFSEILKAEDASISIGKGPVIESFTIKIDGNKKPVTFGADIKYEADVFEGELEVKIEKLLDIDGTFILGSQKKEDESEFTYWYVELNARPSQPIPLGQTGLGLNEIGGGVGFNYDPPIGQAPGAVRFTDNFSLKASIGVRNTPGVEIFSSRLTMVLVSGRFSLNGKVWLLQKEASLFGEGQLDMYWNEPERLEGFVRMVLALPGSDGKLARFNGQVDFKYQGSESFIKSRELEGAILEKVLAEGQIEIKPGRAAMSGNVRYDLAKKVPLAVVSLQVQVNLRADGSLEFVVTESDTTLDASLGFRGNMDVTLETKVRNFDLAAATINAELKFNAKNRTFSVSGSADVSWDTWVHSGEAEVDIGYSSQ